MSMLRQTAVIETPFAQAADHLETFFSKQTDADGVITMRLAAPGGGIGIKGLALERDVIARFRRRKGPNQTIVFELHWEPADGGPYPTFDGALTVAEDETYRTCRLILEGTYTPPGAVAGAVFDAAIGSKIAEATAKQLLEQIRASMVSDYQKVERDKRMRQMLTRGG